MDVRLKRLDPRAVIPTRATGGSAGYDLHAITPGERPVTVPAGGRLVVNTGIAIALPPGYAGLVLPRSGLACRYGVPVANSPGLIDSDYRGEVVVVLTAQQEHMIFHGQRVAQLLILPVPVIELVEVDELDETDRGSGGFGSTGT